MATVPDDRFIVTVSTEHLWPRCMTLKFKKEHNIIQILADTPDDPNDLHYVFVDRESAVVFRLKYG